MFFVKLDDVKSDIIAAVSCAHTKTFDNKESKKTITFRMALGHGKDYDHLFKVIIKTVLKFWQYRG